MAYVRSAGSSGAYTVENGATPSGEFKEPLGFRIEPLSRLAYAPARSVITVVSQRHANVVDGRQTSTDFKL